MVHAQATNTITVILGRKGYGKTFFALERCTKRGRYVFFDVTNSFKKPRLSQTEVFQVLQLFFDNRLSNVVLNTDVATYLKVLRVYAQLVDQRVDLNHTLVIDESQRFMSTHKIHPSVKRLVEEGRHSRLSLVFIARAPIEVNKYVRSQADYIFTSNQSEPGDLKILSAITADVQQLTRLQKRQFVAIRKP